MARQEKGPKVFTVDEANQLIPQIQQGLHRLRKIQQEVQPLETEKAVEELSWLMEDGTISPKARTRVAQLEKELESKAKGFEGEMEQLGGLGAQLKGLEEGLVDFFAERKGELIFLCWKDGEDRIRYWHDLESGFAGRQPIDTL